MSHTSAAPLRTTYCVFQIGSKLARSACGTKRNVRAAARCETAGLAMPPATSAPTPVSVFKNLLRFMRRTPHTATRTPRLAEHSTGEVLRIFKTAIDCKKDVELSGRDFQQFTVFQASPARLGNGLDLMARKLLTQSAWNALVKQ